MGEDEYGWQATLTLAVAVCERIALLADEEASSNVKGALLNHAVLLRDLALSELGRPDLRD